MKAQTGNVTAVTLQPGRADCLLLSFIGDADYGSSAAFSMDPAEHGTVTCDGKPVTVGELFAWLAQPRNVTVTVHPCDVRYGLSLKTEFVDAGPLPV